MREITQLDLDIREIIASNDSETDFPCLEADTRWEVFYHLSPMRKSVLNWYDFREDGSLLEIGGGYGALTGLFCDKCRNVTTLEESEFRAETIKLRYRKRKNLKVICKRAQNFQTQKLYDYIVLIGILGEQNNGLSGQEGYIEFLRYIKTMMKPDGKLFIAVDNRYGLQYFCGKKEQYSCKPFAGINNYPDGAVGYTFSKKELLDLLEKSQIVNSKFYYPLPDYKLTQLIYSQEYLPNSSIRDRVISYYPDRSTLIAVEDNIIDDIIENNVFEFFANSFLIECSAEASFSSVVYAALSTDRGDRHGFATAIHNNGTVTKSALHMNGTTSLKKLYNNIQDLQNHGIGVVKHSWIDGKLSMPYISQKPLAAFLSDIICQNSSLFEDILDRLYNCILKSSEHVPAGNNALLESGRTNVDYGVILEKAYIDMIPYNCFYINDIFMFYDQEFVRYNFPAKYILFRALRHTYFYISIAEKVIPLQYFRDKYELNDLWDIFEKEEARFVEDNRNYRLYSQFYKWVGIDKSQICQNIDKLMHKGNES